MAKGLKKKTCRLCGKAFEEAPTARSLYCSDECREERNRIRCMDNMRKKRGVECVRKQLVEERPPLPRCKIVITDVVPVFRDMQPPIGSIHEAEYAVVSKFSGEKIYIIPNIGKVGLLIRPDECKEI